MVVEHPPAESLAHAELDELPVVDASLGRTPLAWLGVSPTAASPAAVKAELAKLAYLGRTRRTHGSAGGLGLPFRRRENLEKHVIDVGKSLDADSTVAITQPGLAQVGDQTRRCPATAQIHPESGIRLGVEHGHDNHGWLTRNLVVHRGGDHEHADTGVGGKDVAPAGYVVQRLASSSRLRSAQASVNATASG